MANRIRALRDALLSKRPDNSLLCFSAFGRAAVILFPNHWPRKACAQQNWSERVSISQLDRRGGVARQSERWMKRTERPSMEDRAAGHLHQLGKASCRERVCQYVSISVAAASLNKTHTEPTHTHP